MGRALLVLSSDEIREKAALWCRKAKPGARVEFRGPRRTLPQNDRMWAMLTDVATQLPWHGLRLTPDDWKLMFLDGLNREVRLVPNLDENGVVDLGRSSSNLSVEEMTDLLELIFAFGANHGVIFQENLNPAASVVRPDSDGGANEGSEAPPSSHGEK